MKIHPGGTEEERQRKDSALTLPPTHKLPLVLRPHMLINNPFPTRLQKRVQILDNPLRPRNTTKTLHRHNRINAPTRNPTFRPRLLRPASHNLINISQSSLDSISPQIRVQALVRLDAVDLGDARIHGAREEEEPFTRPGADFKADAGGVVVDQRRDFDGGVFAGAAAEPGPEVGEPVVFEGGEVEEGLEVEGFEEAVDGGWDIDCAVEEEEEGTEEG